VLDGIAAYSTELRGRYKGRYPNAVRQDLQALLSVVASKCKDLKALAAHVGADYEMLLLRRKVYDDFVAAKGLHPPQCLHDLRSKERSDKTPIEWIEFAKLYFLPPYTRPGEKKRDQIRNRHDPKDKVKYTRHYFDDRPRDVHEQLVKDGTAKWPKFHLSYRIWNYDLRPFWACKCGRDLCMCYLHLRSDHQAGGQCQARKRKRQELGCNCVGKPIPTNGRELRMSILCPPPGGTSYHKRACINNTCDGCRGLKRFTAGLCPHDLQVRTVKYEKWTQLTRKRKDKPDKNVKDFVSTMVTMGEWERDVLDFRPKIMRHMDTNRNQTDVWEVLKNSFPRGSFLSKIDFSENGPLNPKFEFQSKYFNSDSYTLFPVVLWLHVADLKADFFVDPGDKARILSWFASKNRRAVIMVTIGIISSDPTHHASFVQHAYHYIVYPLLRHFGVSETTFHTEYNISDGCAAQFKSLKHWLWISGVKTKYGLNYVKKYDATGHGKGESDGEGAKEKQHVDAENMHAKKGGESAMAVRTALGACVSMKELDAPTKDITKKGGTGICRRFHMYVPGPGEKPHTNTYSGHDFVVPAVNHNIRDCKPNSKVKVKKQHEVRCIGVPGTVEHRAQACPCSARDRGGNLVCDCEGVGSGRVPKWTRLVLEIAPKANLPTTRNGMKQRGKRLCDELGEGGERGGVVVVAVEMQGDGFFLGEVESHGAYEVEDGFETGEGDERTVFSPGDEVVDILKYEPIELGALTYTRTTKRFPVLVEDVRKTRIQLKEATSGSGGESRGRLLRSCRATSAVGGMRYVLRSEDRAEILATVVLLYHRASKQPIALTKGQAEAVLTTGTEALMGHGIEVAFDFGEQPTWYHGEICGVTADKIRVRYYDDNTRHWHRRFVMEHYGMAMSPVLVQATAGAAPLAGVMSLGQYHWRLLDGRA
jgi:hypothetical protein